MNHRRTKHNGTPIKELLRHQLGLSVWRIGVRRLAAGEVYEARDLAGRGVEYALREADIDVEIALRIADVLEVMRLASKVNDGVDLREVDAA